MKDIWAQETILIVDDTPENLDILDGLLGEKYNVLAAASGTMALELTTKQDLPDLILLDIMMPEMDGYEVCRRLKANPRTSGIPVIFITAKNEEVDEVNGFEVGGVDYITKPVNPAILKSRITTHLTLYNQRRALQSSLLETSGELIGVRLDFLNRLTKTVEYKDNNTGNHIIRMSKLAELIARKLKLSAERVELLALTAPMHDIGKIGVPDSILKKTGPLTEDEWVIMRKHPVYGAKIIGDGTSEIIQEAKIGALTHHEKWNGRGYPYGSSGEDIPLTGRILALADCFDAVTSIRPYKEPWSIEEAVAYIKNERGQSFDPAVVDAFLPALPEVRVIKEELL